MRLERAELLQKASAAREDAQQAQGMLQKALDDCAVSRGAVDEAAKALQKVTKQRDNAWAVRCFPLPFFCASRSCPHQQLMRPPRTCKGSQSRGIMPGRWAANVKQ